MAHRFCTGYCIGIQEDIDSDPDHLSLAESTDSAETDPDSTLHFILDPATFPPSKRFPKMEQRKPVVEPKRDSMDPLGLQITMTKRVALKEGVVIDETAVTDKEDTPRISRPLRRSASSSSDESAVRTPSHANEDTPQPRRSSPAPTTSTEGARQRMPRIPLPVRIHSPHDDAHKESEDKVHESSKLSQVDSAPTMTGLSHLQSAKARCHMFTQRARYQMRYKQFLTPNRDMPAYEAKSAKEHLGMAKAELQGSDGYKKHIKKVTTHLKDEHREVSHSILLLFSSAGIDPKTEDGQENLAKVWKWSPEVLEKRARIEKRSTKAILLRELGDGWTGSEFAPKSASARKKFLASWEEKLKARKDKHEAKKDALEALVLKKKKKEYSTLIRDLAAKKLHSSLSSAEMKHLPVTFGKGNLKSTSTTAITMPKACEFESESSRSFPLRGGILEASALLQPKPANPWDVDKSAPTAAYIAASDSESDEDFVYDEDFEDDDVEVVDAMEAKAVHITRIKRPDFYTLQKARISQDTIMPDA